jgi:hypothetical protein
MDPLSNLTFAFLRSYWTEVDEASTDFVHLGGDIVDPKCWAENPSLAATGLSAAQLQKDFVHKVFQTLMTETDPPMFSYNQSIVYRADQDWQSVFPYDEKDIEPLFSQVLFQALDQDTLVNITYVNTDRARTHATYASQRHDELHKR